MLTLRQVHMTCFFAGGVDVAADKPAIRTYQRQLGEDVGGEARLVGKAREVGLVKVTCQHCVAHADRGLVYSRHDPHGLLAQAQCQVAVLADLRVHRIAPRHIELDGYCGPGQQQHQCGAQHHHRPQGQAGVWCLGRRKVRGRWVQGGVVCRRGCWGRHGKVFQKATVTIIGLLPRPVTALPPENLFKIFSR